MGTSGERGVAQGMRRDDDVLVVTTGNRVERDRVWVHRSSVAFLCMGFAPTESVARFPFADASDSSPFFAACRRLDGDIAREGRPKAERLGLNILLDGIEERPLRRLAIADRLVKGGFNPDEQRDDHGEWTSGGASGSAALGATATIAEPAFADATGAASGAWRLWTTDALASLARLGASANAFALAAGLVLIPGNRSGEYEQYGTLPDNPDIAYSRSEGRLTLDRINADGTRTQIYDAYPDHDYYRDKQGNIIGHSLGDGGGFVVDPAAISALAVRGPKRPRSGEAGADSEADTERDAYAAARAKSIAKDEPQLCPDPSPDRPGYKSPRSIEYQSLVTKLPPGFGILYNGVMFDGCRDSDGVLLEAKAWGYEWAMDDLDDDDFMSPDNWRPWYQGRGRIENQMQRQSRAAGPRKVEWYFAEEGPADYFRWYARESGLTNIEVNFMPVEMLKSGLVAPWLVKPSKFGFVPWSAYRHFLQDVRP